MDEMTNEFIVSEEKAKKSMVGAARLADELRQEQELSQAFERDRKLLECHAKDLQARLDEAETDALKGGKKVIYKMDSRIRDLHSELDAESRRFSDTQKNLRRSERRIKETIFSSDEGHKNHERMQELVSALQGKIKTYKKQIEEAEEIASLNLTKFRLVQTTLAEAEERADLTDQAIAKLNRRGRSSSHAPVVR
jgi:myosin heavy chain 6/7